jgi:putative transposase
MPRLARIVVPGSPHHVTQRGTDRQTVFFSRADRRVYLELLANKAQETETRILAYCLMPNHIHLIAVPEQADSLAVCLRRVHGRYAQYLNARRLRTGHLWQNRFYSCPLDERHLWTALRYVELNPVRAGFVSSAERYAWSSARAHASGKDTPAILDMEFWRDTGGSERWRELVETEEDQTDVKQLRRATYAGQPLGEKEFVERHRRGPTRQSSADRAGRSDHRVA